MDAEPSSLDPLLRQWRELPVGDRRNILQRLPIEQRLTFQRVLAASERENVEVASRAQRFRAYSPWLGALLDACEKDGPTVAVLKQPVRAALLAGHEKATESGGQADAPFSFAALAQSLFKSMRERL
jgi:hypothetical protein